MEIIIFDISQAYMLYLGGFFMGLVLYFVFYSVYSIFKSFTSVADLDR